MKLTIDTSIMKDFFGIAETIVNEIRMHIEPDKVWYSIVDSGNIALIKSELPSSAFREFDVEPCNICIDLVKFKNVFQFKGSDITISSGNSPTQIRIESGGYDYMMTLLADATLKRDPNVLSLQMTGNVVIPGSVFLDAVRVCSLNDSKVRLNITNDSFIVSSKDTEEIVKTFKSDELLSISGNGNSMFSDDYMKDICSMASKTDIDISLSTDYPVILKYVFGNGIGNTVAMIAPRIEE